MLERENSGGLMTKRLLVLMAGVALSAWAASATAATADTGNRKDLQVFNDISKAVTRYAHFTVFDSVDASVKDGVVTLTGRVTMPFKRDDIEKRVAKVDGVREVHDEISVLPVSQFDDQIRYRVARAIYTNPNFWNYAIVADPPIHVVVEHSRVTLTGTVQNEVDKALARSIATSQFGVMSVTSNLKTEAEVKDALEKAF
jgi:osmotically-inducible protein OsmY